MVDPSPGSARRQPLPAVEIGIRILRGDARIAVPDEVDLFLGGPVAPEHPRRLRFFIDGDLLCDEMVMVYGRPLAWAGEHREDDRSVPMVENIFGQVFVMRPGQLEAFTPEPLVRFPRGRSTVAWNYGAVLVRGEDPPWIDAGILHLHAHGPSSTGA